jgi:hypothetical protein
LALVSFARTQPGKEIKSAMTYTREFVYGTKGEDVRAFQNNLLALGYKLPKYGADGTYGAETEAAAKECCQDQHWDYCSWEQKCPIWVQEWTEEAAAALPPPPAVWMPKGRGMWIQSMNVLDPAEAEKVTKLLDLKFVIIQAHWQYTGKGSNTYNWPDQINGLTQSYGCTQNAKAVVEKFRSLGVDVIPFSYPVPGKHQEVIDTLKAFQALWNSPTVVIDPEAEWKSSTGAHKTDALELASMMNAAFPSWGMSTYGAPWFHRTFPYVEFASAPYGLPQTYGETNFGGEGYARAWSEWNTYGYKFLVGLYGTYSHDDSQMRAILSACAGMNPMATAGWKWGTTSDVEWEHIDNILPPS